MSTKDQTLSAELHGEALLTAKCPELQPPLYWFPYPAPVQDPEQLFVRPSGTSVDPIQWMPPDRAERVANRYEYDPEDEPEEEEDRK